MPDKAPVCPWCDTPKDGVSINGIRILESCGNQYGPKQKANFCPLCGRPLTEEAAMKRFEPMQKPLTWTDLEQPCIAYPVWLEEKRCDCATAYLRYDIFNDKYLSGPSTARPSFLKEYYEDRYGKTWRCWLRKPTEEERKAAGWDDK